MPSSRRDRILPALLAPAALVIGLAAPASADGLGDLPGVPDATDAPRLPGGATDPSGRTLPRAEFTTATFNVLGANHTAGRGGHGPGYDRGRSAAQLVRQHGIELIGLQELQRENYAGFRSVLPRKRYGVFPGLGGKESIDLENSVAWKKSDFSLVRSRTVRVPYFGGHERRMPLVLLRHRDSGRQVWLANFHNPASTPRHGNNERWRDQATRIQVRLAKKLAREHDWPILYTGDFNEHEEYFCKVTRATSLASASGGSRGRECRVPKPRIVDLVFGSRADGVRFERYRAHDGAKVRRTSDHPLVVARTVLRGSRA